MSDTKKSFDLAPVGEPTTKQLLYEEQAIFVLGKLTGTQRRRVLQRAEGLTLAQIADHEGVSIASVAESLRAPSVRSAVILAGAAFTARDPKTGAEIDLVNRLIGNLVSIAESATKAIVLKNFEEQRAENVPDYRVRFDATSRLLSLIGPVPVSTIEVERTLHETVERTEHLRVCLGESYLGEPP